MAPVLLGAGALVVLLGVLTVVLANSNSSKQRSPGRHETGTVTVSGAALPLFPQQDGVADAAVGRQVPALAGTDFDGHPVATAASGKPQVLIFLAHWCPHCRNEVPQVARWLAQQGMPQGVTLTSVSTGVDSTRPNYPPSAWLQREGWPVRVLADDTAGSAAQAFGLSGFPFFVFVDADGTVASRHAGELGVEELATLIGRLRASSSTVTTADAVAVTVRVDMGEMWFRPAKLQVPAGKPVRYVFRNVGRVAHQALIGSPAEQQAAEAGRGTPAGRAVTVGPGATGELVVTLPAGTTVLGCHLPGHWQAGMRGTIVAS